MAYEWEREEWRSALQADRGAGASCYRHNFQPDGRGGGVCQCGETLSPEEL